MGLAMAQYLKDDVQQAIQSAALELFALRGFAGAGLADIAAQARVSTGNVYRYHESKAALYSAVITPTFVSEFTTLMHRRIESLKGVHDVGELPLTADFFVFSERLLDFCIGNRLRVVVLLKGSGGTENADFAKRLVDDLVTRAVAHFADQNIRITKVQTQTLRLIYESFVNTASSILLSFEDPDQLKTAITSLSHYHLAGLKRLFES